MNALFCPSNKVIAQFMRMVVREQSLQSRMDRIDIGLFRFLEIYVRQYFPHHRGNGYSAGNDVVSHLLFAGIAFQPVLVDDAQRLQFAPAHSRIEKDKQGAGCGKFGMSNTIIDKLLFFLIGKGAAFLALMLGKYDLCHRGIEFIVARG